jgi:hypothetical protein
MPTMRLANRRCALGFLTTALLLQACSASPPRSESAPAPRPSPRPSPSLGAASEQIPIAEPRSGELHFVYDLADTPELWAPAVDDELIASYRARASARLGGRLSARDLLERQRSIHRAMGSENARGESNNGTLVLEGRAGTIGPATWIESLLFREQARRYPILEYPTEFGAFILRAPGRVRVYFSSLNSVGGRIQRAVTERVAADAASGFEVTAHLHNHSFLFDRVPGDRMWTTAENVDDVGGGVAPSTNDVQFYRNSRESEGLRGAWVTNGLDTGRFDASDFDRLTAAS